VTEGFSVGAQVNVRAPMLDASSDCWFCDDSEDPNPPLPVGGYVVQVRLSLGARRCLSPRLCDSNIFERSFCLLNAAFVTFYLRVLSAMVIARTSTMKLCRLTPAPSPLSLRKLSVFSLLSSCCIRRFRRFAMFPLNSLRFA
jgi:hypothetical protein